MRRLLIAAPLTLEALAVKVGAPHARVCHTGMGPARSMRAARKLGELPGRALAVMGFCGALDGRLRPGDIVVATEVRGPQGSIACPAAKAIADALQDRGLRVHAGPLVSVARPARGRQRRRLAQGGALAVDMESAWLVQGAGGRVLAVVRAVVDTPERELTRPVATALSALRATRSLARAAAVLDGEFKPDLDCGAPTRIVGVSAAAPVPAHLGHRVQTTLRATGAASMCEPTVAHETVHCKTSAGLRKRGWLCQYR